MKNSRLARNIEDFLKIVVKDPCRKNIAQVLYEYAKFQLSNQALAEQYFAKCLYHRGVNNFSDYLLTRKLEKKCWKLNDKRYTPLMDNKHFFELFFSQFNLKVVQSLAYNYNSLFFLDNKIIQLNSSEEFGNFLRALINERATSKSIFIKKTQDSYGGSHIYKVSEDDVQSNSEDLDDLYEEVTTSGYLFQDMIVQHDRMNELNPYCVNTVRISTYSNKMKSARILSSYLRTGATKAYVDNISSGGLYVDINVVDGSLNSEAFTHVLRGGGKTYKAHPGSGLKFEAFEIPFYKQAKELAVEAARHVPQLRIVGWDIAIQPDGPMFIEGNSKPGLYRAEVGQKGFANNPVFMELYDEIAR
jgi:hypothetical protein